MIVRTRYAAAGLLLGLAALLVPGGRSAPAKAEAAVPAQVRESVGYLAATYHVSTADALRRLRLSAAEDGLGRKLSAALPREYAGARMDQRDGGVLVVAATRPDHARRVVSGLEDHEEIRVVPAAYSLRDLTRVRDRVAARTSKTGYAQVDEVTNHVDVWTADRAGVTRALAGLGADRDAVVVRTAPKEISTACAFYDCDPPMRGGILVTLSTKDKDVLDYCSAAFNVEDDDGDLFTSTAGHCITLLKNQNPRFILSSGNNNVIGDIASTRSVYANDRGPRLDYAFVRVTQTDEWFPAGHSKNALLFQCSVQANPPQPCDTANNALTYAITGTKNYDAMGVGEVVCMAGASPMQAAVKPGVRCGEITAKPDGGIQTNICAKRGDSGSPLFNQTTHQAYGIENSVASADTGPCLPPAEQQTFYTPISAALAAATAAQGRTYSVITD
jgi:streptogrisin C